jgi:hypothetical protein
MPAVTRAEKLDLRPNPRPKKFLQKASVFERRRRERPAADRKAAARSPWS